MENDGNRQVPRNAGRGLTLVLLALLIAAACALFYSDAIDDFTAGYGSWLALVAIPAALGSVLNKV